MKYIKSKILFESAIRYSIYDFFEDIKSYRWGYDTTINKVSARKYTDIFIGPGWYDKIDKYVNNMFDSMSKVDTDYVYDRLYDIWDEIPNKEKNVFCAVSSGSYKSISEPKSRRFNGYMTVMEFTDRNKFNIICNIIIDIIYPTLNIDSGKNSIIIRESDEEVYVTDSKYNCENFNISYYKNVMNDLVKSERSLGQHTIDGFSKYSPDNILSMYVPSIIINIGGHNAHRTGTINLLKLESDIDDILPTILPTIDYDEVIFDMSRGTRRFDEDRDIHEYTFKILLKF